MSAVLQEVPQPIKLDIGCGKSKQAGFVGIDAIAFEGVDKVLDVRKGLPYKDGEVEEIFTSHFLEHLTGEERVPVINECYRVLKSGGKMTIIVPDWSHDRAYGDPTHKFPPFSRWSFSYLNKAWRDTEAPHCGYTCDFEGPIGGQMEPWVQLRNPEAQQFATQHYVNALTDLIWTGYKR